MPPFTPVSLHSRASAAKFISFPLVSQAGVIIGLGNFLPARAREFSSRMAATEMPKGYCAAFTGRKS